MGGGLWREDSELDEPLVWSSMGVEERGTGTARQAILSCVAACIVILLLLESVCCFLACTLPPAPVDQETSQQSQNPPCTISILSIQRVLTLTPHLDCVQNPHPRLSNQPE